LRSIDLGNFDFNISESERDAIRNQIYQDRDDNKLNEKTTEQAETKEKRTEEKKLEIVVPEISVEGDILKNSSSKTPVMVPRLDMSSVGTKSDEVLESILL